MPEQTSKHNNARSGMEARPYNMHGVDGALGVSERFSAYTDMVLAKLKWKKVRPLVKEELTAHLAESSDVYGSDDAAMAAMGSPEEAGSRLNGLYKPRVDVILLIGVGLLMALALWVVPLGEWAIYALGVLALGAAFAYLDVRNFLQKYGLYIFLAGVLALMLVPTPLFTRVINGARRSLPVEFVGMFLCICGMGAMLGDGRDVKHPLTILRILALTAIPCLAILVMPHFAILVMFGFSIWAVYCRSKMPRLFVWALLGLGLLLGPSLIVQTHFRFERFAYVFSSMVVEPSGAGYLPYAVSSAWRNAQWFGPAVLEHRIADIVRYMKDYSLTYLATALGKLPAYLAIALNALVVWRMLYLSLKLKDRLSSIVSFGASVLMAIMSGVGILGNFGLLFSGGHAMFINASGSYWLLQGACAAIVFALNLNRDYIRLSQGSKPDVEDTRRRLRIRFEWTK